MVWNALAAAGVGFLMGLTPKEIQRGIGKVESVGGRSHVIPLGDGILIDDCYNANPVSMRAAIDETNRRRAIQQKYNEDHNITPQSIKKAVRDLISISRVIAKEELQFEKDPESMSKAELEKLIGKIEKQMKKAAADLNFEAAAELRDKMAELKKKYNELEK